MKIILFSLLFLLPIVFQNCSDAQFSNSDTFSGKRQASESDLSCSEGVCEDSEFQEEDEGLVNLDSDTDSLTEENGAREDKRDDLNEDHADRDGKKEENKEEYADRDDTDKPNVYEVPNTGENPITLIEQIFEVEDLEPLNPGTCAEIFNSLEGGMDLQGKDLKLSGNYRKVIVRNANKVKVSGNTQILVIDGAKEVKVSGNVGSLCVRAHHIDGISGNVGGRKQAHLIIGQEFEGAKALAKKISGNTRASTFILDIDVENISGNSHYLYTKNSDLNKISGGAHSLTLEQSTLKKLSGNVNNLLLIDSSIDKISGNIRTLNYEGQSVVLEVSGNIN